MSAPATPPSGSGPVQITLHGPAACRYDHRIPIADSCSIRSGVSVVALLR